MNKKRKEVEVRKSEKKWPDWHEKVYNRPHTLTPRIKKFVYLYVSTMGKYTLEEFAEKFGVHASTITLWLAYPVVKEEIGRLLEDTKARVKASLEIHLDDIVKGLFKIFQSGRTNAETRRKIANDFLGYSGINNVNTGRQVIVQQTAVNAGEVDFSCYTEEDMRDELEMLEEFRKDDCNITEEMGRKDDLRFKKRQKYAEEMRRKGR